MVASRPAQRKKKQQMAVWVPLLLQLHSSFTSQRGALLLFFKWNFELEKKSHIIASPWWRYRFFRFMSTYRELSLRVPDHQVCVVARRQATLLLIKATQLGRPLAQQPGHIRQREAPLMGRAPEQRQTCARSQGHRVIWSQGLWGTHGASTTLGCVPAACCLPSDFNLFLVLLARQTASVYLPGWTFKSINDCQQKLFDGEGVLQRNSSSACVEFACTHQIWLSQSVNFKQSPLWVNIEEDESCWQIIPEFRQKKIVLWISFSHHLHRLIWLTETESSWEPLRLKAQ